MCAYIGIEFESGQLCTATLYPSKKPKTLAVNIELYVTFTSEAGIVEWSVERILYYKN